LPNNNHNRIFIANIFTNSRAWDPVKTLSDRNASDFQRGRPFRASDLSVKSVISVIEKPPNRTPKITETHRKSPKAAAGAGGREIGYAGRSHLVQV